jgi:uncharacterized membrane protein YkoI
MELNEKSVVKIDGDGTVVKCAKNLAGGECGYQPDTKVCGKCGAMAVEIKMVPIDELPPEEEEVEEDLFEDDETDPAMENGKPMLKTKGDYLARRRRTLPMATRQAFLQANQDGLYRPSKGEEMDMEDEDMYMEDEDMDMEDEEMYMDDENAEYMADEEGKGGFGPLEGNYRRRPNVTERAVSQARYAQAYPRSRYTATMAGYGKAEDEDMGMEDEEMYMDDEGTEYMIDEEGKMYAMPGRGMGPMPRQRKRMRYLPKADDMMPEGEEDEMYMEGEDEMMEGEDEMMEASPDLEAMRMARLRKLGTKSADVGMNGYMCAIDRKVYPGATSVCDDCPGGCMSEKGMPGLLHVEGLVEVMFKGDVIDSGYSQDADMYVIDVETKSGNINEVFVDGTTAEVLGFHRLDDSVLSQKSIMDDIQLIDFNEAAEIAVKSIPGSVVAVEPAVFEGFDSYQVEINGIDGKSYDVFVALDGETLGYDAYKSDETEDIEAEAAEIALKRAFSEETRQSMAKEGTAMSDGSFPIASENDLRNAIMAHGRAKDPEAAKEHIKKRAAAMGLDSMLPDEWKSQEKSDSAEQFIQSLVEFEMLAAEVENPANNK